LTRKIAVLKGDGVGPEVIDQAVKVLRAVAQVHGLRIELAEAAIGRGAFRLLGHSCPEDTIALCRDSDAVLFGATGGPADEPAPPMGNGNLILRRALQVSCNLRPIRLFAPLLGAGPIKAEIKARGFDFVIVRGIGTAGAYGPGDFRQEGASRIATSLFSYTDSEVRQVLVPAFALARSRHGRLHLVSYSQIINASRIWKIVFDELRAEFSDVECFEMLPDQCNQAVARDPAQFDVIVFDDLFRAGMVVDLGAVLVGSVGMSSSAALRPRLAADGRIEPDLTGAFGMYEPSHGTANARVGQDIINPIGAILAVRDLMRHSLDQPAAAAAIETAVEKVLQRYRTYDLVEPGTIRIGCSAMGDRIAAAVSAD
jgi:3-isopropylmalate dehydrogenase